jgi:hypothetical protein
MKTESMNQALAATARIACLVALVGCRNSGEESYTAAVDSGGEVLDTQSCELETDPECSLEWAVASYNGGGDNALIEPCCELLLEEVGYIYECCLINDWEGTACMAWGPPRPPAVGRRIRAAQGAERVGLAARAGVAA